MQCAVIEFCRNVLGIKNANSLEFDKDCTDVITTMNDTSYDELGGTLRLGSKPTIIKNKDSVAYKVYGEESINERHRHRYEVNPKFIDKMQEKGFIFSGKDKDSERMTICEIPSHPFFFGSQYHPEYKTNPFIPTPMFYSFVLTASKQFDKFKKYTQDRQPGVMDLEAESDDMITSKNEKYDKMIKLILNGHTNVKEQIKSQNELLESSKSNAELQTKIDSDI